MIDLFELLKDKELRMHDKILLILVEFIYNNISKTINYDHQTYFIPKNESVPLELNGRKYDISFIFKDRIIFLEIKTRKIKYILKNNI